MIRKLKLALLQWLVKDLFKGLMADDILSVKTENGRKVIYHKGKRLDDDIVSQLKSSASTLEKSRIWKVLLTECEYKAEERIFRKATNSDDLFFGKAMLYLVEQMKKALKKVADL